MCLKPWQVCLVYQQNMSSNGAQTRDQSLRSPSLLVWAWCQHPVRYSDYRLINEWHQDPLLFWLTYLQEALFLPHSIACCKLRLATKVSPTRELMLVQTYVQCLPRKTWQVYRMFWYAHLQGTEDRPGCDLGKKGQGYLLIMFVENVHTHIIFAHTREVDELLNAILR